VEIKTKKSFNELITSLSEEILDEITSTDGIDGYNTPFAFSGKKSNQKRKKKVATNSTGYDLVEGIDDKDIIVIKKLIRQVVANIIRDIWIKRNVWKNPK
tara:strand:- start:913 stop:1212 length:300 start_codon:yes stop_codon:yes gene_type:complete